MTMQKTNPKSISPLILLFLTVVLLPGCALFSPANRNVLEISTPAAQKPTPPPGETPQMAPAASVGSETASGPTATKPSPGAELPAVKRGASPFQGPVDKKPALQSAGPVPTGQTGQTGGTPSPAVKTGNEPVHLPESLGAPAQGIRQLGGGISLNFDQASLSEVVTVFAEMLKINYIVMADLRGQVTIQSSGVLAGSDLMGLFYQILQANGLTAIKNGDLYKIVPIKDAARILPDIRTGSTDDIATTPGVLIQVVKLQYINCQEMSKILTPFLSAEGSVIANDASHTLVIVDQQLNLLKAMQLIATFDVDLFANLKYRFIQPRNIASKDMLPLLTKFTGLYNKGAKEEIEFFGLDKINSILVITASDRLLAKVDELLNELDKPSQEAESHIYIYFLKNSQAGEMASLLNTIFTGAAPPENEADKGGSQADKSAPGVVNPFAAKLGETPQGQGAAPRAAGLATAPAAKMKAAAPGDFGSGSLRGQVKISKDEIRNALIIEAIPPDYLMIEKVLQRLDILPRQVLVSVKVAQVQLDDSLNLGVEWSFNKANSGLTANPDGLVNGMNNFWRVAAGSTGLSYLIGETNQWNAKLNALAENNKVNILSSPSVLASDNKPAKIEIATEVPVASSVSTYDSSVSKTQTEIQYRTTGVLLDVTPHINEYGLVSMEISQEVSDSADAVNVGGASYPAFLKRSVKTSLTVNDGQTVVIGGLISEKKTNNDTGVPFFSQLPLLGWIFGNSKDKVSKTELIILITPRVVANLEDVDAVTREFSRKVGYEPHTVSAQ